MENNIAHISTFPVGTTGTTGFVLYITSELLSPRRTRTGVAEIDLFPHQNQAPSLRI